MHRTKLRFSLLNWWTESQLREQQYLIDTMSEELKKLREENQSLRASNQTMRDEHDALHMTYESLERRHHAMEKENIELVQRYVYIYFFT